MYADPNHGSIPLYLTPDELLCEPVLSHNSPTNNLLLKITVPRRTGRKRKRGSQDPYIEDPARHPAVDKDTALDFRSHSRLDTSKQLLRSIQDSQGSYGVEVAGIIEQTHRFRGRNINVFVLYPTNPRLGLSDFHQTTAGSRFMQRFGPAMRPGYRMWSCPQLCLTDNLSRGSTQIRRYL